MNTKRASIISKLAGAYLPAVERDGSVIGETLAVERNQMAVRAALVEFGADIVLAIGGTGPGIDDHSAAALAEAGELAIYGLALRPWETTGLGRTVSGHCQLKQGWYPPAVGGAAVRCREVLGTPIGPPPLKRKGPGRSTRPS
jgi:molybdopterin molybdotransferase